MSDFNSLQEAFEKAEIKTTIKDTVSKNKVCNVSKIRSSSTTKRYIPSERLALSNGFEEIPDPDAYNGRYFVKNKKIWIHDIEALKARLGVSSNRTIELHGYDVDTYYRFNNKQPVSFYRYNNEMANLYASISHSDREPTYLSDGVWLYPDGSMRDDKD